MSSIYLFSILIVLLLSYTYNNVKTDFQKKICLFLIILILVLISGLRVDPTLYSDEWNYRNFFNDFTKISFESMDLGLTKEPGFTLLNFFIAKLTHNSQMLIFICALFTNLSFILFLNKYSKQFTFSLFLYIAGGSFFSSMNIIRQYLAMAIILFGFQHILNNDLKRFSIFVFIAFLFHKSAILGFFFYYLINSSIIKNHKIISFILVTIILLGFNSILSLFANSGYGNYVESYGDSGYGVGIIRVLFWEIIYVMILYFKRYDTGYIENKFLNSIFISLSILLISMRYVFIARLDYLNSCSLTQIPEISCYFKQKRLVKCTIYFLFFIYGWYLTKDNIMTNLLFGFL